MTFDDRRSAGQRLAQETAARLDEAGRAARPVVLALPRGGVPVAAPVAEALGAELDVMLVRKLGAPGRRELALGAVASGGARVLNTDLVHRLGVSEAELDDLTATETRELERREHAYRGDHPFPDLTGRTTILVDDGVATGATMRAALRAVRSLGAERAVVAVPLAPKDTVEVLRREADQVICLASPEPFLAVGQGYRDFPQVTDEEVKAILRAHAEAHSPRPADEGGPTD